MHNLSEDSCAGQEYARRMLQRERQLAKLSLQHQRLLMCLAVAVAATCLVAYLAFVLHSIAWAWVILPALGALAVTRLLARNSRDQKRTYRIIRFYDTGIERLHDGYQAFDGHFGE